MWSVREAPYMRIANDVFGVNTVWDRTHHRVRRKGAVTCLTEDGDVEVLGVGGGPFAVALDAFVAGDP